MSSLLVSRVRTKHSSDPGHFGTCAEMSETIRLQFESPKFPCTVPRWVMRAACLRKVHPKKKQNVVNILTKFLRNL